jgi:hypothetical protein
MTGQIVKLGPTPFDAIAVFGANGNQAISTSKSPFIDP